MFYDVLKLQAARARRAPSSLFLHGILDRSGRKEEREADVVGSPDPGLLNFIVCRLVGFWSLHWIDFTQVGSRTSALILHGVYIHYEPCKI